MDLNTIEKLGDEETFKNIVERTIIEFEDNEIEEIGNYAFSDCSALTNVSFPLVTRIGNYAFNDCSALTNVSFPLVTSIRTYGFLGCSALTNVSFPLVTSIGLGAFRSCNALTNVSFPRITSIGDDAFVYSNALTTMYIGTESDTVCTLKSKSAIPSSIEEIYVPYNLREQYKTATNWSSFADKIQSYEVLVSCQSMTITAEDVPGYKTSTIVHYEAVCTYSIEGIMQTGTKVFKGDAVSDTFSINPSGESSRQVEVSYTFLGQTTTTTITQDKYLGNPVGGKIYYIDDTADGTYSFYDAEGNLMSDVSVGSTPSYYKVLTSGSKDKYYVYHDELYTSLQWGKYGTTTGATGTAIGTGKSNTAVLLATDAVSSTNTIWYKLQQIRNASTGDCNDWFVPSKDEVEALRLAIGCTTSTSGAVVVDAGAVTGGTIAGTADGKTHYKSTSKAYYCYPSATKFLNSDIWSSSKNSSSDSHYWYCYYQYWSTSSKGNNYSVFFARAF